MNEHNDHSHHIKGRTQRRALIIVLSLTASFMIIEAVAGFYTGSLALISDSAHMFTDVFALSIALFALWLAQKPPTSKKTYGFYRIEIISAFFNSLILFGISIGIIVEAINRIKSPHEIKSMEMIIVAFIGLIINILGIYILSRHQRENLNIKGAFYHIISDALGSLGVLITGFIILKTNWYYADSIISIIISVLIIRGAWILFSESFHILLEGTPRGIDLKKIEAAICSHRGVLGVHDLHAWTLTQGFEALSAHLVVEDITLSEGLIKEIKINLFERFKIKHVTLQAETEVCEEPDMTCYELDNV